MARRTNIVDFDEAKAASRSRRSQSTGAQARRRKPGAAQKTPQRDTDDGRTASSNGRPDERRASSRTARGGSEGRKNADRAPKAEATRRSRNASAKARANAKGAKAPESQRELELVQVRKARKEEEREQRRRERTKARADKMFDKQFATEAASAGEGSEGAPRAALYEGRMGSSQRRATRMQLASEAAPVSAKIDPSGWFSNLNVSPRTLKVATAVLCLVLTCAFLYVPAQQYYKSIREHDKLEAEYAVIAQRNELLDEQNDSLAGNAGMEDAVRQKYGYVIKGDQTAIVTGLSEHTTDTSRDGEEIQANVLSSAVKAPEEWYTPYLDAFFGVS